MAKDKIAVRFFKTEGEVKAFKLGLFWNHKALAADMVTSMLLTKTKTKRWKVEVIEVAEWKPRKTRKK